MELFFSRTKECFHYSLICQLITAYIILPILWQYTSIHMITLEWRWFSNTIQLSPKCILMQLKAYYDRLFKVFIIVGPCMAGIVGFTTTCTISAYHQWSCEFESRSWRSVIDTTLCDKVWQRHVGVFFPVSPINCPPQYNWHPKNILYSISHNQVKGRRNAFRKFWE